MTVNVACVLRTGGEYKVEHVKALQRGVEKYLTGARFICFSDVPTECERIPLEYNWPGWWSKMELFKPGVPGSLLYIDLDTVIVGSLEDLVTANRTTVLLDFYRKAGVGSGLMFLPEAERAAVWDHWMQNPQGHMGQAGRAGDQRFLERHWAGKVAYWQHLFPGQVVSYKEHVVKDRHPKRVAGKDEIPEGARVVCFHGNPRPWSIGWLS